MWQCDFLPSSPSPISGISPHAISPQLPTLCCSSRFPQTDPSVWWSPPCVHVLSLFNTHLWVRTCGIWFSVLVSVCWEWWSQVSSMPLQRIRTHCFWWLHNIPWCICAIFSLSSLSLMGIRLVPSLCYCKLCCNEHSCAYVLTVEQFIILWVYTQYWDNWVKWNFYF